MIMKTLYEELIADAVIAEGILTDIEDTLNKSDDDIQKHLILQKLHDKEAYYFPKMFGPKAITDDQLFKICKVGKTWVVHVKDQLTYYGKWENVTDGSFQFGTIEGAFVLSCRNSRFKSLQYGPIYVYGDFDLYDCDGLKNLRYCPKSISNDFHLICTNIETLKWMPAYINGNFNCNDNKKLTSLDKCGKCKITGAVQMRNNGFKSSRKLLLASNLDVDWLNGCLFDD